MDIVPKPVGFILGAVISPGFASVKEKRAGNVQTNAQGWRSGLILPFGIFHPQRDISPRHLLFVKSADSVRFQVK